MISVKRRIEVKNTPTGKRLVVASAAPRPEPPPPEVRVASVARLLADVRLAGFGLRGRRAGRECARQAAGGVCERANHGVSFGWATSPHHHLVLLLILLLNLLFHPAYR
jgi:hypothetical protein